MLLFVLAASCGRPADEVDRDVPLNLEQEHALGKTPAEAYLDPNDRALASKPYSGGEVPCEGKTTAQCVKMTRPQRWSGIWKNDLEGSRFCLSSDPCAEVRDREQTWLTFEGKLPPGIEPGRGGAYQIEFFGKRTQYPGMYGHLGMSEHEIVVDRLITIREIEPPPPDWTEEERKAWEEKCRKAQQCMTLDEMNEMQKK